MLELFLLSPLWVDVRFNQWDAILAKPEPLKELPATHVMWRYARTQALTARGEWEKAAAGARVFHRGGCGDPRQREHGRIQLQQRPAEPGIAHS